MAILSTLLAVGALVGSSAAYPAPDTTTSKTRYYNPNSTTIPPYVAPGPNDSRAPCPALNTLANHGYLPHDGRNISRQDLMDAVLNGLGVQESAIDLAITNAFQVCKYVEGKECNTLTNLTVLAEPHAFEHEHSISRGDYHMASSNGAIDDNRNFNQSVFQGTLDVVGNQTHMDYQTAQQMRLVREQYSRDNDYMGWFQENRPVALFEIGFIFAVMGDFNKADYLTNPQVRVDWWSYWFEHESFPVPLGWHKPNPPKDVQFVESASSRVANAPITSVPTNLPADATAANPDAPGTLPNTPPDGTTYFLPSFSPYQCPPPPTPTSGAAAATGSAAYTSAAAKPYKRQAGAPSAATGNAAALNSVESVLGPAPTPMNHYQQEVSAEQFAAQIAYRKSRMSEIQSKMSSA